MTDRGLGVVEVTNRPMHTARYTLADRPEAQRHAVEAGFPGVGGGNDPMGVRLRLVDWAFPEATPAPGRRNRAFRGFNERLMAT